MSLKIINFHAENIKKLVVVDITPDSNLQIIGGKNSQGKSSVLDAIFLALAGGDASKAIKEPVRKGEDYAVVRLDLGDYVVTREWKGDKSTLKVEAANGAKFASPQGLLDSLLGRLAFDPLEFMRLSPKEQKDALLDLVHLPINLEALAIQRQSVYDLRTAYGREVKSYMGQLEGLGEVEEAPEELISVGDLLTQVREAEAINRDYIQGLARRDELKQIVADLEQRLVSAKAELAGQIKRLEDGESLLPDVAGMQDQLANVEETNSKVRRNKERAEVEGKLAKAKEEQEIQSSIIEDLDNEKNVALSKAVFPVPGLSFTEDGVTYNSIPLDQASDSEKIRVSLAMAMALNPTIRVIRVNDGSLLDSDNLQLISEMAKDQDYQIFLETVGDNGVGIIMESGEVKTDYSKEVKA